MTPPISIFFQGNNSTKFTCNVEDVNLDTDNKNILKRSPNFRMHDQKVAKLTHNVKL